MNTSQSFPSLYKVGIFGVLFILCVILAFSGYSYVQEQEKIKAIEAIRSVESIQKKEEQMQRLAEIEGSLPSYMTTAIAIELGNYAVTQKNFEDARIQYEKVAKRKDALHIIGILGEARAYIQLNKPLEAIAILQPLTQDLPNDITSLVLLTLAEAQEDAKRIDDAIKTYTRIASIDNNSYGYIQYKLHVLQNQNKS